VKEVEELDGLAQPLAADMLLGEEVSQLASEDLPSVEQGLHGRLELLLPGRLTEDIVVAAISRVADLLQKGAGVEHPGVGGHGGGAHLEQIRDSAERQGPVSQDEQPHHPSTDARDALVLEVQPQRLDEPVVIGR
jgi:hypothetical protein